MNVEYLSCKNSDDDGEKMDDIASILNSFKNSKEIHFTTLSDMPVSLMDISGNDVTHLSLNTSSCNTGNNHNINDTVTVSTTKSPNDEEAKNKPVKEIKDLASIEEKVKLEQLERNMKGSDILFISVAWIVMPAFQLFVLCPELIWCDVTLHSNNKGYSLFTFSS